jgi:hypothetical protein
MKPNSEIVLSVLDLAGVREGGTVAESFRNTRTLAPQVDKQGYVAEQFQNGFRDGSGHARISGIKVTW